MSLIDGVSTQGRVGRLRDYPHARHAPQVCTPSIFRWPFAFSLTRYVDFSQVDAYRVLEYKYLDKYSRKRLYGPIRSV